MAGFGKAGHICWRKQELQRQLQCHPQSLSVEEMSQVHNVLEQHHGIFSIDKGERGETNHVEFNIDTDESTPIKQVAHKVLIFCCRTRNCCTIE